MTEAQSRESGVTVVATYRVAAGNLDEFSRLLQRHYPTLKRVGLVTDDPPVIYKGEEKGGGPIVYEIFSWKDERGSEIAHQTPEVMAIWEPMGALVEARDGRPPMEFPHVSRWDLLIGEG